MIADLTGRTALVTGGGQGIGRGICLVLAEQGADVAVADIVLENGKKVAREVEAKGRKAMALLLDVTSQESANKAVQSVIAAWGHLDILVNNAGIGRAPGFVDEDREVDWEMILDINVKGVMHCVKAVSPHFKERKYGKIINIASGAGRGPLIRGGTNPGTGSSPYGASKAAVINYTKYLAAGLGPYNINVNAICPGFVWTFFHEERYTDMKKRQAPALSGKEPYQAFVDSIKGYVPLGREQTPEDIGKMAAFLASEDAKNISGQSMHVDGGARMM